MALTPSLFYLSPAGNIPRPAALSLPAPRPAAVVFTLFLHPAPRFFQLLCPALFTLRLSHIGKKFPFLQERNMSLGVIAGAVVVLLLLVYLIYALIRAEAF